MKTNYHTHNFRCNHAIGNVEDYIKIAIEEGFDEIGISDHLPHPGKNIDNESRMTYEEIPEYFAEIRFQRISLLAQIANKKKSLNACLKASISCVLRILSITNFWLDDALISSIAFWARQSYPISLRVRFPISCSSILEVFAEELAIFLSISDKEI